MRRFSISQLTTMRWSLHQDVVRYQLQGFNSMGIWRQKVEDCDVFEVADYLHEMRMNVSSVHWAGGFTGGNGVSYEDAMQDAIEAIEMTSRLNSDCLIVHPGCRNGHTSKHARRLFLNALEQLVLVASDFGVRLAIELMPCPTAHRWTFMKQMNCALELLSEFPEEELGLVLDLYHVGLNEEVFENLDRFAQRIALVQLADRRADHQGNECGGNERRLALGEGQVPFDKWFQRLQELGFNGVYEVEIHGEGVSHLDYSERLDTTKTFIQSAKASWVKNPSADRAGVRRLRNQ